MNQPTTTCFASPLDIVKCAPHLPFALPTSSQNLVAEVYYALEFYNLFLQAEILYIEFPDLEVLVLQICAKFWNEVFFYANDAILETVNRSV
jgi:hypothetical protein